MIEEHGDRAERILDRLDRCLDLGRNRDICGCEEGLPAVGADLGGNLFALAARQIDDADTRAFAGKKLGGRKTTSPGASADQCGLSSKPACHRRSPRALLFKDYC